MRVKVIKTYSLTKVSFLLVVAAMLIAPSIQAKANSAPQEPARNSIPEGQKVEKFKGIVVKRDPDAFAMTETTGGPVTVVLLTNSELTVQSHKKGLLRGSKDYGAGYILRGLRLEVDGVGDAQGNILARRIRFDEQDLRTAQALRSTVDPLEAEARENLKKQQAENERLAGQIAETQAVAASAREDAAKAQATADLANNRINGLDDFDSIKTITVNFATSSSKLGPKAKAEIDNAAAWVKTQNTKGWVMAVIGYADTTGSSAR